VPLAQVRDLLGHESIKTTERYDSQTPASLRAAAALLEAGKTLDTGEPSADGLSSSFQVPAGETAAIAIQCRS
jgi:hypothetical protein